MIRLFTLLVYTLLVTADCGSIQINPAVKEKPGDSSLLLDELKTLGQECSSRDSAIHCMKTNEISGILKSIGSLSEKGLEPAQDGGSWLLQDSESVRKMIENIRKARTALSDDKPRETIRILSPYPDIANSIYGQTYAEAKNRLDRNTSSLARALDSLIQDSDGVSDVDNASRIRQALAYDPAIGNDPEIRARLLKLREIVPEKDSCRIQVKENDGLVYASSGFENPPAVQIDCASHRRHWMNITSNGAVQFASGDNRSLTFGSPTKQEVPVLLPVKELSTTAEDNKIGFSLTTAWPRSMDELARAGLHPGSSVSAEPSEYAFRTVPQFYSASYAELGRGTNDSGKILKISGKMLEVAVASNGQFTIGALRDGKKFDLFFGHPNGRYADGIWSSFVSLKIDGQVFRMHQLADIRVSQDAHSVSATGILKSANIEIKETLTLSNDPTEAVRVSLEAKNLDSTPHNVGFRLLADTWAGDNDGVPFLLPGLRGAQGAIQSREVKFNAVASSSWETFDPRNPMVAFLHNQLAGPGLTPPDEAALVNWSSAFSTDWDYDVSKDFSVTGDSATLLWWKETRVAPASNLSVTTEFRTLDRKEGVVFSLNRPNSGMGTLFISLENSTDKAQHIKYSLKVNGATMTVMSPEMLDYALPPRERLDREIPIMLAGTGNAELMVQETRDASVREIKIPILLPIEPYANAPYVWTPDRSFPVFFTSSRKDMNLRVRLRSPDGTVLDDHPMNVKTEGESSIYSTLFSIDRRLSGRIRVEVYEP